MLDSIIYNEFAILGQNLQELDPICSLVLLYNQINNYKMGYV
jgi:hypothetical protein